MRDAGTKSMPLAAFVEPPEAPRTRLAAGQRIGRYRLVSPLGRGGMADVWIAELVGELGFSRVFALKTILAEFAHDANFRESFFSEARIAARLRHTNIVEVVDLGEEGSILFQVMTLVEGESLQHLFGTHAKPFPCSIAARIINDTLAGLHAAHELTDENGMRLQLVHRDVSPHNILVGLDGISKLTDFGIVKVLGGIEDAAQRPGKPGYYSPEQLEGRPLDRRSDIFSAGTILWELITGRRLFRATPGVTPMADLLTGSIPDAHTLEPTIPIAISRVVKRALMRAPSDRFSTALEMSEALEAGVRATDAVATPSDVGRFLSERCGARIEGLKTQVRGPAKESVTLKLDLAELSVDRPKRNRVTVVAATTMIFFLFIFMVVQLTRTVPPTTEPIPAVTEPTPPPPPPAEVVPAQVVPAEVAPVEAAPQERATAPSEVRKVKKSKRRPPQKASPVETPRSPKYSNPYGR